MRYTVRPIVALSLLAVGGACAADPGGAPLESFDAGDLAAHIQVLASDEFEGRAPSSLGEQKTVEYLSNQFRQMGLRPGNGDSYVQAVPLVSITVQGSPTLSVRGGGRENPVGFGEDYVAWTKRVTDRVDLRSSEMVFVGYGIVAPEYKWNDYDGIDVSGKTVVILVNDPGFTTQDPAVFNGNTMTYYGRWTYKFEEAARQGAAGAFIVHQEAAAGYPWGVVEGSWTGPQFDLVRADDNMGRVAVEGWITDAAARGLFAQAGQDYEAALVAAQSSEFTAVSLGLTATVGFGNDLVRSTSSNVLGVVPGSGQADEYVVYMAHWDHFGKDETLEGDQIYNGAFDNATGVAGLLELAQAYAGLETAPSRSVLFLAVTAEEQGLLGSAHYAQNPVYPTNKTIAAINIDGMNNLGPMHDVTVVGLGNSELDDYLEAAATEQGRVVRSDPEPEKGFYYRSDHFSFAKQGIPALYTDAGVDHVEHGEAWALEQRDAYTAERYHKPTDEFDPTWDLSGAVDDLHLLFAVGYRIAMSSDYPNWRDGTEFKALRDIDMAR